ncbi:MAG: cyclopropane-fatty-acyl-phospholipid synthase family protein [Kofleriaceae bacterium]
MQSRPAAPSSIALGHPLLVPMPRWSAPLRALARRTMLAALGRGWRDGRLDVVLPDGERVAFGGAGRAEATVRIRDERAFVRMLLRGELGAGEAYTAGDWDADDLTAAVRLFLRATGARGVESTLTRLARLTTLRRHRQAANDRAGSARNIYAHYDLGNAFYREFLDEQLVYSCGIWADGATTLAEAQTAKLERLCALAQLGPGDHALEIGCGWGALAIHAARTRGCRVTAITVSPAQLELARQRVAAAGVAELVTVELRDYRDVVGQFDAVLSCEMLEAVGYEFLPRYFAVVGQHLKPGRRAAIQSITMPDERFASYRRSVDWMQTYIFPGSLIPSLGAIRGALAGSGLTLTSADDIGPDYAPTLAAWRQRFTAALPTVRALGFDEAFIRAWHMYLAFSEAAFAERTLADHQLVFTRT